MVYPGWTPRAHQKCSITPLLSWTGERKYDDRLVGREKDGERSLTNYHHGQSRLNVMRKKSLICHQSSQSKIITNKTTSKKQLPPTPPFFWGLTSLLNSPPPPSERRRGTGNGG